MTSSALIERLVQVRNDRRQYGTDIIHTEHELVEAIRSSGPQKKEAASK